MPKESSGTGHDSEWELTGREGGREVHRVEFHILNFASKPVGEDPGRLHALSLRLSPAMGCQITLDKVEMSKQTLLHRMGLGTEV